MRVEVRVWIPDGNVVRLRGVLEHLDIDNHVGDEEWDWGTRTFRPPMREAKLQMWLEPWKMRNGRPA